METAVANGTPAEGADDEEEVSWYRGLSDEIGDIVPGLNLSGDMGAAGHQQNQPKVKRPGPAKGRGMGKFGRGRRRNMPKKAHSKMMRAGPNATDDEKDNDE